MKQKIFAVLFIFSLFSCHKDFHFFEKELPNYENVELDHIFNEEEKRLNHKQEIISQVETYYEKVWEKGNLSGGFLVAKGDQILFEKYRGYGRENKQMPIDSNTPLHVASISKTLTAMAVLKLIEAGQLKMHQKVTDFFPKFPYPDVEIFHLLSHRSGLPKYEYFVDELKVKPQKLYFTNNEILNILIRYRPDLVRKTHSGFMYCNTNYAILALIIEEVTQTKFPEAMSRIVFKPLEMEHTFIFQPERDEAHAAQSFFHKEGQRFPLDKLEAIYGDKNCYTTPRDLLNFSKAMYSPQFLRKSLKDSIFIPYSNENKGINNYGLGCRMKNFENGKKLIYHNGWWHGTNSSWVHLLDSKVTLIAIGNKYAPRIYTALALSGLFEEMPAEKEKLKKLMNPSPNEREDFSE